MTTAHWIHFAGMTIGILVDNRTGRIVDVPEIVSDFLGRPLGDLLRSIEGLGILGRTPE
jgi:hypothetical protein